MGKLMVFTGKMDIFQWENDKSDGFLWENGSVHWENEGFHSENESYQWEKIVLMIKLSGFSGKVYVLLGKVGKYRL